jgi:hypothetical protein
VTTAFLCRVLPSTRQSAREKVLGKEGFADVLYAEPSLPSATLGKSFAECFPGFAECFRTSAKPSIPVVIFSKKISSFSLEKNEKSIRKIRFPN